CRPAVVLAGVHHPLLRSLQGGGNFRRWASPSDASATNASPPHSFALRQRVGQKAHRIGKLFLLNQGVKERRRRLAVLQQFLRLLAKREVLANLRGRLGRYFR